MSATVTSEEGRVYRLTDANTAPFRYAVGYIDKPFSECKIGYIQLNDEQDVFTLDILPMQWDGGFKIARGNNIAAALDELFHLWRSEGGDA